MNAVDLLRGQIEASHGIVEGTVADLTPDMCDKQVDGKAHPIGATYAHILASEDAIINMMIRGQAPLMAGEWAGKTGMSEPPPMPGGDVYGWATSVKVDLAQAREYAKALYKSTDEWLASLSDADLDRELDVPGFGKNTLAYYVGIGALIHPANHVGEISALKGIQGAKGYPF